MLQFQEAIKILTGSTKYQGIDKYLCNNVVHPEFYKHELPRYPIRRMGILVSI